MSFAPEQVGDFLNIMSEILAELKQIRKALEVSEVRKQYLEDEKRRRSMRES